MSGLRHAPEAVADMDGDADAELARDLEVLSVMSSVVNCGPRAASAIVTSPSSDEKCSFRTRRMSS